MIVMMMLMLKLLMLCTTAAALPATEKTEQEDKIYYPEPGRFCPIDYIKITGFGTRVYCEKCPENQENPDPETSNSCHDKKPTPTPDREQETKIEAPVSNLPIHINETDKPTPIPDHEPKLNLPTHINETDNGVTYKAPEFVTTTPTTEQDQTLIYVIIGIGIQTIIIIIIYQIVKKLRAGNHDGNNNSDGRTSTAQSEDTPMKPVGNGIVHDRKETSFTDLCLQNGHKKSGYDKFSKTI